MNKISEKTWQALRRVYEEHNEKFDALIIDRVAADALEEIDPERQSTPEVVECALMQLLQMTRQLCRHFKITRTGAERAAVQEDFFSDRLQDRYSVTRDGREMYVKRSLLTLRERNQLTDTLTKLSGGFERHAKTLKRETAELLEQGLLKDAG
jgi:hypothetical protein